MLIRVHFFFGFKSKNLRSILLVFFYWLWFDNSSTFLNIWKDMWWQLIEFSIIFIGPDIFFRYLSSQALERFSFFIISPPVWLPVLLRLFKILLLALNNCILLQILLNNILLGSFRPVFFMLPYKWWNILLLGTDCCILIIELLFLS